MMKPITTQHIVISGFTEHNDEHTGSWRIYRALAPEHYNETSHVMLLEWKDDWRWAAIFIDRYVVNSPVAVKIYAYSWGAGYGAMKLARELNKRNIPVRAMVLSDPVYRSTFFIFRWLAMLTFGFIRIKVPPNVQEVWWFYQKQNRPRAHQLVRTKYRSTKIHAGVEIHTKHQGMDEARLYREKCLEVAKMRY